MYNKVILIGNLTRDVELRYATSGTAIGKFGLATNRTYKDNMTGENKQDVMFIDITVFGRSAEIANQYLSKGKKVMIEGRLQLEQWTAQDGTKRSKHSVVCEKLQFMDNRQSDGSEEGGYAPQPQQQPYQQQRDSAPRQQQTPEIDINEEDIPF